MKFLHKLHLMCLVINQAASLVIILEANGRWLDQVAQTLNSQIAAWVEWTANWSLKWRRNHPSDRIETGIACANFGNRAQERLCVGMFRGVKNRIDIGALNDIAEIHDRNIIRDFGNDTKIVGDKKECH